MSRREKLEKLLDIAPPVGADVEVPDAPPRFAVLERDDQGDTLWMYFGDSLDELKAVIAESETRFVEQVRVHDLDANTVLAPIWMVEKFETLEDDFSYEEGYATIR